MLTFRRAALPRRLEGIGADDSLIAELRPRRRRTGPPQRLLRSSGIVLLGDLAAMLASMAVTDRVDGTTAVYVALVVSWLALLGSYRPRIAPSLQADLLPLMGALCCPVVVLAALRGPTADRLLHDLPATVVAVAAGRLVTYLVRRVARAHTTGAERTLIVGSGVLGCSVARALIDHPEYGLEPVGFIDGYPDDPSIPLPVLGDIDAFDRVVRHTGAVRVIVAFGANREADIVEVLRASVEAHVEVHILPRLFELGVTGAGPDSDLVWGFPLHHARRAALRTPAWRSKRLFDVIVTSAIILVTWPIMLAAALAVRLSSEGPILFRQERLGQRGEIVQVLKFRSMRPNNEADTRWGTTDDDRVTKVGRLLRSSSIDELPQLFNVLRGDMSLVGPRPERPHFATEFDRSVVRYRDRLRVPVGMTGWAQVHGLRGDTSIEERARFDNFYIEHWSLWFDLVIVARTAGQVAREVWAAISRPRSGPQTAG